MESESPEDNKIFPMDPSAFHFRIEWNRNERAPLLAALHIDIGPYGIL